MVMSTALQPASAKTDGGFSCVHQSIVEMAIGDTIVVYLYMLLLLNQLVSLLNNRRDGVVVRASASQSVDLGFIPLVESYQKTLKNGIYSFPAWRSAFMGGCGEQAGKFACCVLGQGT